MNNFLAKDARRFRITLSVMLVLIVASAIAFIVFSVQYIESYAATVQTAVDTASTSQANIDNIANLANRLKQQSASVARVEQIVADSKSYQYQDVIINDLRAMADKAGVSITNFDFAGKSSTAAPAPSAPAPSASAAPSTQATSSLNSTTVSITLSNPVNYQSFLNFIHYIELNNTKMQISSIMLSSLGTGKDPNNVNSEALRIEVYIR